MPVCLSKISWNKTHKAVWIYKKKLKLTLIGTFTHAHTHAHYFLLLPAASLERSIGRGAEDKKIIIKKTLNVKHNCICKEAKVKRLLEARSGSGITLGYQNISSSARSISFV